MITEKNLERLENIVAHYAMKDYKQANPKRKMRRDGSVIHNPYSLSDETNQAREMLILARKLRKAADESDAAMEKEEQVKAYLLRKYLLLGL